MLRAGRYLEEDVRIMQWVRDHYGDQNIANKVTYKLTEFIHSVSFDARDKETKEYILKLGKAIRQDFKKMLLAAKSIYEYSLESGEERPLFTIDESGYAVLDYNEDKDLAQMQMEYFLTKYRVIHEYLTNIVSRVVSFDKAEYARLNPDKLDKKGRLVIKDYEISAMKREYFESMFLDKENIVADKFNKIRRIRNDVIHNGAFCLLFDGEELLFQVYNLDVDDIAPVDDYISNGYAISCNYFMAVNISYLVYYLDCVFSLMADRDIPVPGAKGDTYCGLVYKVDKEEEAKGFTRFVQKFPEGTFDNISDAQKCFMEMIETYL